MHCLWANPARFINKTSKGTVIQSFFIWAFASALQEQSMEGLLSKSHIAVSVQGWVGANARPLAGHADQTWFGSDLMTPFPGQRWFASRWLQMQSELTLGWDCLVNFRLRKKRLSLSLLATASAAPVFSVDVGNLCYFRDRSGYKPHQSICLVFMWKEKEILYNPCSWSAETLKYEIWL